MLETGKVGQLFSSVVSRALAEQKVIEDLDSSKLVGRVMYMQVPDLNVVAMLAWSEVMRPLDVVVGQRGWAEEAGGVHGTEREMVKLCKLCKLLGGHSGSA